MFKNKVLILLYTFFIVFSLTGSQVRASADRNAALSGTRIHEDDGQKTQPGGVTKISLSVNDLHQPNRPTTKFKVIGIGCVAILVGWIVIYLMSQAAENALEMVDVDKEKYKKQSELLARFITEGALGQLFALAAELSECPKNEIINCMEDDAWREAMGLGWEAPEESKLFFGDFIAHIRIGNDNWKELRKKFVISDSLHKVALNVLKTFESCKLQTLAAEKVVNRFGALGVEPNALQFFIRTRSSLAWHKLGHDKAFGFIQKIYDVIKEHHPNLHEEFQNEILKHAREEHAIVLKGLLDRFITQETVLWVVAFEVAYTVRNPDDAYRNVNEDEYFHPHGLDNRCEVFLSNKEIRRALGLHWPQFDQK